MDYRIERDSMGEVRVPADRYWGAQTQRSLENFPIGTGIETMPQEIIHAFGILKGAARMMLSMGRLMSPAALEKQGLNLLGTQRIKEKLMHAITEGLQQAGLDIELADMTAEQSAGGQMSQATDGSVIPADYEKKLMADMTAEVQKLRGAARA